MYIQLRKQLVLIIRLSLVGDDLALARNAQAANPEGNQQ